ncbi:MAG: SDR family NAD(P)-dependent oxidoreductase [Cyanobacteria bacterium P01_G01_bin.54]
MKSVNHHHPLPPQREPIAIVGMGCRFPGGANSPAQFWRLLQDEVDAITEVPLDRWSLEKFYDPDPTEPGKIYSRWGGFVDGIEEFDARFFKISTREAISMDPQHRLLLEVTWEALENAGQAPEQLAGSDTGVFVGLMCHDYGDLQLSPSERDDSASHTVVGSILSMAANRISYTLDLRGPSLTLDTACSSSMVAVHLACQSLWNGECTLAVAGGANALLKPEMTIAISQASLLASDGRCKSFDARADGYVRGEGAGMVVLKPLAQAQADGDPIAAVILASTTSQDGRKFGVGAPTRQAQTTLLQRAYQQAGVAPRQVQYVEAHGTGTAAGDPAEVNAIGTVLGGDRPADQPCWVGSVKSNIGHLEAAAGVASLIKVALCLQQRQIPASLHFEQPNPNIDFATLPLKIPTRLEPWPDTGGEPAVAGVNSFGFGGTNAHLVVQEYPAPEPPAAPSEAPTQTAVLPLSTRQKDALQPLAKAYLKRLEQDALSWSDLCALVSHRRSHHEHRLAIVADSAAQGSAALQAFLRDAPAADYHQGSPVRGQTQRLVFVCSGMGPQWWAMGRELLETEPIFRAAIEDCDRLLHPYVGWSLLAELTASEADSRMGEVDIAQPAHFALQVALARLWQAWGIEPEMVVGHSAGEVAAAHLAGILDLADAVQVIVQRSQLQKQAAGQGTMLAVSLNAEQAELLLVGYGDRVCIAAINSPSSMTLAGDREALEAIADFLGRKGIFAKFLAVDIPFHGPAMDALQAPLVEKLQTLSPHPPRIPFFSTVTGQLQADAPLDAAYWAQNLRQPVQFGPAIAAIIAHQGNVFLELSSHPVLGRAITENLAQQNAPQNSQSQILHCLRRQKPERPTLLQTLAQLYALGYAINWAQLYPQTVPWQPLPTYPWQRKWCWKESEASIVDRRLPPAREIETVCRSYWLKAEPITPKVKTSQNWLLISRDVELAERLADTLSQQKVQQTVWQVKAQSLDDLAAWLQSNAAWVQSGGAINIVYVNGPATGSAKQSGSALLQHALEPCLELVSYLQALKQHPTLAIEKIYILTDRAQAPENPVISGQVLAGQKPALQGLSQAAVFGLGRVIANELPTAQCKSIDLDYSEAMPTLIPRVVGELFAEQPEQEVALRKGRKYLHLLQPAAALLPPASSLQIRPESTYLVVGGFGGFGLAIAQWLVENGCQTIALVSRTIPADLETLPEVRAMRAQGATVTPLSCDVSQAEQVVQLFAQMEQSLPPLRGIIHSAMVLKDASLANLSPEHFQQVFAPKVAGAWNLHQQSQRYGLEHFVLCSSVSAVLGTPGQGNYVAANAFLDALAHQRHALGLPALSVNWGLLADVGYVIRKQKQEMFAPLERVGWVKLPCQDALAILGQAMGSDYPQVVVAPMNWAKWKTHHALGQSFRFSHLGGNRQSISPSSAPVPSAPIAVATPTLKPAAQRLASPSTIQPPVVSPSPVQQPIDLQRQIQQQVAQVLQMAIAEVDLHQSLIDMGLDSLTSVELQAAIRQQVGVKIALDSVLSGCTIADLSEQTWAQFQALSPSQSSPAVAQAAASSIQPIAQPGPQQTSAALPPLNPEEQRLALQGKIQQQVAQVLQMAIAEVDLHQPLIDMGLDSLTSVELQTAITQQVGVQISLDSVLSGGSIAELAEQTGAQFQARPQPTAIIPPAPLPSPKSQFTPPQADRLQPAIAQPPASAQGSAQRSAHGFTCLSPRSNPLLRLFCFPYAGGGPSVFKDWPQEISDTIEVYALQLPGRSKRLKEKRICDMQSAIADMLESIQPLLDVPAVFFGHCIGALQMFELTHRLQAEQKPLPIALFASGARSPQFYTDAQFQMDVKQYSPLSPTPGHQLPEQYFLEMLKDLDFSTSQALFDNQEMRNLLLPTVRADLELNNIYRYQAKAPLDIPIFAVGGRVDPYVTGEHILGWQQQTTHDVADYYDFCPGNHYFIETQRPFIIRKLLSALREYLNCTV